MNPELPTPQLSPEQLPARQEQTGEYGQNLPNPETTGERTLEREQNMRSIDAAPLAPPPIVFTPPVVPQPLAPTAAPDPSTDDDNPAVAGDADLIEKEWVDKAKKIIRDTRDDPYRREQEVNKLQIDYLQKRYGKQLGATD